MLSKSTNTGVGIQNDAQIAVQSEADVETRTRVHGLVEDRAVPEALNEDYAPIFDRIKQLGMQNLGETEIQTELTKLGLISSHGELPVWQLLTRPAWLSFLRELARHAPAFAFQLAACRVSQERDDCLLLQKQPLKDLSIGEIALVSSGCLWHAWEVTLMHARQRPLFRRHLVDFPAIQLRLLRLFVQLLEADEWASLLATSSHTRTRKRANTALRHLADDIRIETQLLCGGTGYMCESTYAKALAGLQIVDQLLRGLPNARAPRFPPLQNKIAAAVRAKLQACAPELSSLSTLM